jgi:hypothetical protein
MRWGKVGGSGLQVGCGGCGSGRLDGGALFGGLRHFIANIERPGLRGRHGAPGREQRGASRSMAVAVGSTSWRAVAGARRGP